MVRSTRERDPIIVFGVSVDDPFQLVGTPLDGRFDVLRVVGEGGFAVVYKAHHQALDAPIALKVLKIPHKLDGDERAQFLESFLSEGKLLHKLSRLHPAIVSALDVGATTLPNQKWAPYLVLEWLEGETLEQDLERRRKIGNAHRNLRESMDLLSDVAEALRLAHDEGVAHRDVKPANIFLLREPKGTRTKILDFGIAKVKGASPDLLRAFEATGSSLSAFTPRYAAPEQFDRSYGTTGPWTDVFAFALLLVEMVVGHSPLDGDPAQIFVAACNRAKRPTFRALGHDEGEAVEGVFERALAVDPADRFQNVGHFWDALRAAFSTGATVRSPALFGATRTGGSTTEVSAPLGRLQTSAHPTKPEGKRISQAPIAPAPTKQPTLPPMSRFAQSNMGLSFLGGFMILGAGAWMLRGKPTDLHLPPPDVASVHLSSTPFDAGHDGTMAASPSATDASTSDGAQWVRWAGVKVLLPRGCEKVSETRYRCESFELELLSGEAASFAELYVQARREKDLAERWIFEKETTMSQSAYRVAGIADTRRFVEHVLYLGTRKRVQSADIQNGITPEFTTDRGPYAGIRIWSAIDAGDLEEPAEVERSLGRVVVAP